MPMHIVRLPIHPNENRIMDHLANLYLDAGIVTPASFGPVNLQVLPITDPRSYLPTGDSPQFAGAPFGRGLGE